LHSFWIPAYEVGKSGITITDKIEPEQLPSRLQSYTARTGDLEYRIISLPFTGIKQSFDGSKRIPDRSCLIIDYKDVTLTDVNPVDYSANMQFNLISVNR
jgi:hypothetical protein